METHFEENMYSRVYKTSLKGLELMRESLNNMAAASERFGVKPVKAQPPSNHCGYQPVLKNDLKIRLTISVIGQVSAGNGRDEEILSRVEASLVRPSETQELRGIRNEVESHGDGSAVFASTRAEPTSFLDSGFQEESKAEYETKNILPAAESSVPRREVDKITNPSPGLCSTVESEFHQSPSNPISLQPAIARKRRSRPRQTQFNADRKMWMCNKQHQNQELPVSTCPLEEISVQTDLKDDVLIKAFGYDPSKNTFENVTTAFPLPVQISDVDVSNISRRDVTFYRNDEDEFEILHNNIRPENILVDRENLDVKFVGFSQASYGTGVYLSSDIHNSFGQSPEVKLGCITSPESDVFALGSVLQLLMAESRVMSFYEVIHKTHQDLPKDRPGAEEIFRMISDISDTLKK